MGKKLTEGWHEGVARLRAPGWRMQVSAGVVEPKVVVFRPTVVVDLDLVEGEKVQN